MKKVNGFTFIEIMVVLVIAALVIGPFLLSNVRGYSTQSQWRQLEADVNRIADQANRLRQRSVGAPVVQANGALQRNYGAIPQDSSPAVLAAAIGEPAANVTNPWGNNYLVTIRTWTVEIETTVPGNQTFARADGRAIVGGNTVFTFNRGLSAGATIDATTQAERAALYLERPR